MKRYIIYMLIAPTFLCMLTSCELFGLKLQQGYDYDSEVGIYDNQLKMPAWEWMNSRKDLFSCLLDAIEYAEIDHEIFNRPNQTLLLITNQGLNSATASNRSYWYEHQIEIAGVKSMPVSWDVYPKEQVRDFILYHIVNGAWSYYELSNATQGAITFFSTYSTHPNGYVALQMKKEGALSIYFNNFNHYIVNIKARTNNLQVPNGTYIHVLNNWLNYPSDVDMALYPIYKITN